MPKYVYDAWSLKKEVCTLQKLWKVFHCLPLAELRLTPWHCSNPSIFARGTQCWLVCFLCQEAILKYNLQENVFRERNPSYVILQYFLKIMTLIVSRSKLLRRGKRSNHSKTTKNHLQNHDLVWNYDCSLLNNIYHGISYPWYFILSIILVLLDICVITCLFKWILSTACQLYE